MNTMILAAGFGTRFRPHTEIAAKPTFPFLNTPLLYYSYFWSEFFNTKKTVINTHHLPESVLNLVDAPAFNKKLIHISHETEILGNGGALLPAKEYLDQDHFLVTNADTVIIPKSLSHFHDLFEYHKNSNAICTLMLMPHPEAGKKYGAVWINKEGRVKDFGKKTSIPELTPYHFFGIRIFSPKIFDYVPEGPSDIFLDILQDAIAKNENVQSYIIEPEFFDGGRLDQYLADSKAALELFENSEFLQKIAASYWPDFQEREHWRIGTGFKGDETHPKSPHRLFGKNTSIAESCELKDMVIIGNEVQIGENCRIKNAVIADGIKISDNSIIENDLILNNV